MKSLRSFFLLSFAFAILFGSADSTRAQSPDLQKNQRQFLVSWQNSALVGLGTHRPYSEVRVEDENGDVLWNGTTNARGQFTLTIAQGSVDPAYEHQFYLKAFDQFGREILKEDGTPDILEVRVLPGLQAEGQTDPNAEITLYDADGNPLNRFYADDNGKYVIVNAPAGSTLKIEKDGGVTEVPFAEGTISPAYVSGEKVDPETTVNNGNKSPKGEEKTASDTASSGNTAMIVVIGVLLGILILGFFFYLKKPRE